MKAVIFGPPKTGKTTIFNALTGAEAPTDRFAPSHPPNLGSAPVADRRLEHLCEVHQPKKRTPALVDYVDLAGVADLSSLERKQQALLLPQLQQADLLVQVCRAFEDPALPQPEGTTVAAQMQDFLETLLLLDLEAVATLIARQAKGMARAAPVEEKQRFEALQRCQAHLEQSRPLRTLGLGPEEEKRLRGYAFLTLKPVLVILNLGEEHLSGEGDPLRPPVLAEVLAASPPEHPVLPVYGKWEMELAQMAAAEAEALRRDLGMAESTLDRFVATTYRLLGLHAFFTVGPDECRAWTVAIGTVAPRAAGKIHSDMERGFIRAEVVAYDDFVAAGGMAAAKKAGTVRLEGKEYVVRDGDIINFRFNV